MDNINEYQIFLIFIITIIAVYSVILQYKTLKRYKDSKFIDVVTVGTQKNVPCVYKPESLPNHKCYDYTQKGSKESIEYVIYNSTFSKLTYGLGKNTVSNVCNMLCTTKDYYELQLFGSKYTILNNLDVISINNPKSKGMTVNVKTGSDNSITEITSFNSSGVNYDLNDILQIVHKEDGTYSDDEICSFKLTNYPKGGCTGNTNYDNCIIDTVKDPKCRNTKPLAFINGVNYYPNIVWVHSIDSVKVCSNNV